MDDSVRLIEAELGLSGFALVIKLWQEIYKGEGYYKRFDEDVQLLFSKEVNVSLEELKGFLDLALSRGIFDRALFEKYEILFFIGTIVTKKILRKTFFCFGIEIVNLV